MSDDLDPVDAALLWDRLGHWAQDDDDWVEAERCYRNAYDLDGGHYVPGPSADGGGALYIGIFLCILWNLEKQEIVVAGKTVSAYADEGTAAKVAEMARVEDRSPAQIAAAALRFYVRLPQAARDAIRRLEAGSGKDTMDEAAWAAGRALIDKQYEASLTAGIAAGAAMLPADASEEDILTAAVDLSRRH